MQQLSYINNGRGGTVIYKDDISEIKFDFEFGGGNCVAIIFTPTPDEWEYSTKRKFEERDAIIQFVAEQSLRDQVAGGYYSLYDSYIELYKS